MNTSSREFFGAIGEKARLRLGPLAANHIKKLDQKLIAAGEPGELKGVQLFGIQLVVMIAFPVVWGFVLYESGLASFLFEGPKQILVYLLLMLAGFAFPTLNLGEKIKKRQKSIALHLSLI